MDELKRYEVLYTESAEEDILSKAAYIEKFFRDPSLALKWYQRLKAEIQKDLSFFPYKFQLYDISPWNEKGIREFILRNDVVLYSVYEEKTVVYIHAVFTRGKNLSEDIADI